MVHFLAIPDMKAPELARLFIKEIYWLRGLPQDIVSDCDSRFAGEFWHLILWILAIKEKLSMAFHPETDRQTERVNQILEQFLRISMVKKDWDEILPIVEFEYNNSHHLSAGMTPFYANFEWKLWSIWPINQMKTCCPASTLFAHNLEDIHELLKSNLKKTRAEMIARHNTLHLTKDGKETAVARCRMQHPEYKIGDEVLLDTRNMPWAKLNTRKTGLFRISWVGRSACKLEGLPEGYHPIFHVSLLEPYHCGPEAPPPIELSPLPNGQEHYIPEKIIEHGLDDDNQDIFWVLELWMVP